MVRQMRMSTDAELRGVNIDPDEFRESVVKVVEIVNQHGGFAGEQRLRSWGIDADDAGILWLPGLGAPRFQFHEHRLLAVVERINKLLSQDGTDPDPWGAADWWLLPHSSLDGAPVDSLNTLPAHELIKLALAEVA